MHINSTHYIIVRESRNTLIIKRKEIHFINSFSHKDAIISYVSTTLQLYRTNNIKISEKEVSKYVKRGTYIT